MGMTNKALATAAGLVAVAAALVGCASNAAPTAGTKPPAAPLTTVPSPTAATTSTARPVHDLTPGNCTLYTKADATKLLGAVNDNNKALDIKTDGGTKIDVCSYLDLIGGSAIQGVSYAVVRYDSDATAYAEAKKVQVEMLGDAASHNWSVQSLTAPVPGAGPLLGGYGTKTDFGIPATIAVVGTNVGPYLVVALGGSTTSADNAKSFALKLFTALAAATS